MRIRGFALACIAVTSMPATAGEFGKWSDYIPSSGSTVADVTVPRPTRKLEAVIERVREIAADDPVWLAEMNAARERGEGLPYDERLGMSRQEYARLMASPNELVLTKVDEATLTFTRTDSGVITLSGLPFKSPADSVSYDPATEEVKTAYGALNEVRRIHETDPETITGRWTGTQWNGEFMVDQSTGLGIRFAIGRRTEAGDNLIYFDINEVTTENISQQLIVLLYSGAD